MNRRSFLAGSGMTLAHLLFPDLAFGQQESRALTLYRLMKDGKVDASRTYETKYGSIALELKLHPGIDRFALKTFDSENRQNYLERFLFIGNDPFDKEGAKHIYDGTDKSYGNGYTDKIKPEHAKTLDDYLERLWPELEKYIKK